MMFDEGNITVDIEIEVKHPEGWYATICFLWGHFCDEGGLWARVGDYGCYLRVDGMLVSSHDSPPSMRKVVSEACHAMAEGKFKMPSFKRSKI